MKNFTFKFLKIFQIIVLALLLASGNILAGQDEAIQKVREFLATQESQGASTLEDFNKFHKRIQEIIRAEYKGQKPPPNMDLLRAARTGQHAAFEKGMDGHRKKLAQEAKKHALIEIYTKCHNNPKQAQKFLRGLAGTGDVGSWALINAIMDWTKDVDFTMDHLDPVIAGELQAEAEKYILDKTGVTHLDLDIVATGTGHERKASVFIDKSSRHLVDSLLREAGGNVAESIEFVRKPDGSFDIKKTPMSAKEYLKKRFQAALMTKVPSLADADGKFDKAAFADIFSNKKKEDFKNKILDYIKKDIRLKGSDAAFGIVEMLVHAEGEGRGKAGLETAFQKGGKYLKRGLVYLRGGEVELAHVYQHKDFATIQKKLQFGEEVTKMKKELANYRGELSIKEVELFDQTPGSGKYEKISREIDGLNEKIQQIHKNRDQAAVEFFKLVDPGGSEFPGYDEVIKKGDTDKWVQKYFDANRETLTQISSLVVEQSFIDVMKLDQEEALTKLKEFQKRFEDMVTPHKFEDGSGAEYHGLQDQDGSDKNRQWAEGIKDGYKDMIVLVANKEKWDSIKKNNKFLVSQFTSLSDQRDLKKRLPEDPSAAFHKELAENMVGKQLVESLHGLKESVKAKPRGIPAMLGMVGHLQRQAEQSMGNDRIKGLTALSQLDMALTVLDNFPMDGSLPTLEQSKNLVMIAANMYIPYLGAINAIGEGRDMDVIMREIVSIFCPLASAPEVVKSLGTRAVAVTRTFAFDSQLQVLYANSEFSTPKEGEPKEEFQPKFLRMYTKNNDYQGVDGVETFIRDIEGLEERGGIFDRSKLKDAEGGIVKDIVTGFGSLADSAVIIAFQSVVNTGEHKLFRDDAVLAQLAQEYTIQLQLITDTKAIIKENGLSQGSMEHRRLKFLEEGLLVKDGREVKEEKLIRSSAKGLKDRIIKRLAEAIVQTFEERARNEGLINEEDILKLDKALILLAEELRLEKALIAPENDRIDTSNKAKTFFARKALAAAGDGEKKKAVGALIQAVDNYRTVSKIRQIILIEVRRTGGIVIKGKGALAPLTGLGALFGNPARDLKVAVGVQKAFADLYESILVDLEYDILEGREEFFGLVDQKDLKGLRRTRFFALVDQIVLSGDKPPETVVWGKIITLNLPAEEFADHVVDNSDIGEEDFSWWETYNLLPKSFTESATIAVFGVDLGFDKQLRKDCQAAREQAKKRLSMTTQRYWQKIYDIRQKMSRKTPLQIVLSFQEKDINKMPLDKDISITLLDTSITGKNIPVVAGISKEENEIVFSSSVSSENEYVLKVRAGGFPEKRHEFAFKNLKRIPVSDTVTKSPADSLFPSLDVEARRLVLEMDEAGEGLPAFEIAASFKDYDGPPIKGSVLEGDILAFQSTLAYLADKENVPRRVIWTILGPEDKKIISKSCGYGKNGDVLDKSHPTCKKQEGAAYKARFRLRLNDMEKGKYKVILRHESAEDPEISAEAEYSYIIASPKLEIKQLIVSHNKSEKAHMREVHESAQEKGRYTPVFNVGQKAYLFVYFTMPDDLDKAGIRFTVANAGTREEIFSREIERERKGDDLRQRVGVSLDQALIQSDATLGLQAVLSGPDAETASEKISFEAKVPKFEIKRLVASNYKEKEKHQEESTALSSKAGQPMTVLTSDKQAYFYIYYTLPPELDIVNVRWDVVDSAGKKILSGERKRERKGASPEQRVGISEKKLMEAGLTGQFQATLISPEGEGLTKSILFMVQQPPVVIKDIFVATTPDAETHSCSIYKIKTGETPYLKLRYITSNDLEQVRASFRVIDPRSNKVIFEEKFNATNDGDKAGTFLTATVPPDTFPPEKLRYRFEAIVFIGNAKPVKKSCSFTYGIPPSLKGLLKVITHFDTPGSKNITVSSHRGPCLKAKPDTRIHYEAPPVYPVGLKGCLRWRIRHGGEAIYEKKIPLDGSTDNWGIKFKPRDLNNFGEGDYYVRLSHHFDYRRSDIFHEKFEVKLPFSASIINPIPTGYHVSKKDKKSDLYITKLDIKGLKLKVKTEEFATSITIKVKAVLKGTNIVLAEGEKSLKLNPKTEKIVEWPMSLNLIDYKIWSKFPDLKWPEDYFKTVQQEFTITDENGLIVTNKGEYKVYVLWLRKNKGDFEEIDDKDIWYIIKPPKEMQAPVSLRITEGFPVSVEGMKIVESYSLEDIRLVKQDKFKVSENDEKIIYRKTIPFLFELKDNAGVKAYGGWKKFTYTHTVRKKKSE